MSKDIDEELFDKYSHLILYSNKLKELKNVTKGHKQRFINMVLEVLKFRGKNLDAQIWIYYILVYFQKHINKYIKAVDEPVAVKLEQQIKEVLCNNPHKIEFKPENNCIENSNSNNKSNKEKEKDDIKQSNNNVNGDDNEAKIKKKMGILLEKINKFNSLKDFICQIIDKENRSNKIFCEIYQFITNFNLSSYSQIMDIGNIKINVRQKLLNLICLIFPFISNKQKIQIKQKMKKQFESDAIDILEKSKFIDMPKNNNIFDFLILSIINQEINGENLNNIFLKKLIINIPSDIFDLYKIYILISIFKFPKYETYINHIAFKMKFILDNYEDLYADKINFNFKELYNILLGLKKFYVNGYNFKVNENDNIKNNNNEISFDLFAIEEKKICEELFKNLGHFYKIPKNIDLISGYAKEIKCFDFPFNLLDLIEKKNNFIKNNFQIYKANLINIEKRIYQIGCDALFPNNKIIKINDIFLPPFDKKRIISKYSLNGNMKFAFNCLNNYLHSKLVRFNFKLYPYGSSTEFLSDRESDIDLFLDLSEIETKEKKIYFLYQLMHYIKTFDRNAFSTISTRVCVITFRYMEVNFDISVVGFCPYLHSILIREYSLIDPRFPMLLISIKHIIKILKINNISEDRNHSFLNSFSWSLLLIAFLQDIIQPPILPKILTNSESITIKTFFGNNKLEKEEEENCEKKFEKLSRTKNFESFINNMELNDIQIPLGLGDINTRRQNYLRQIKVKNNMTCSELLLKFLEFIIYHFKYDTLFINCSFSYEGFQNIDNINYYNSEDDAKFLYYFKTKYIKRVKDIGRDGYFLFRDPFDPRYNPGQTLKASSLNKFFSRLNLAYFHLLEHGNLNLLKKYIEDEESKKRI